MVPIDGNPFWVRDDFELIQIFIFATDLSEYTIEFIQNVAPQLESSDEIELLVEEPTPSKPEWKGKASVKSSKGKAKAKVVESEAEQMAEAPPLARGSNMGEGKAKATEVVAEESVEASAPTKSARAKAKAAENKSMKAEAEKPATRGRKMASATSKTCATAPATRPRSARLAAIHSCWSHFRTPIITIIIELPLPARAPPKRQRKPSPALTEDIDPDTGIFTDRVRSPRPGSPPPPSSRHCCCRCWPIYHSDATLHREACAARRVGSVDGAGSEEGTLKGQGQGKR
ncbi:hypothetical protein MVEN_02517200 [Mycena venus]|uniref:Uncharacterized protein n=1 Tax=Mycena venus TaxID=2733690 RepID=A0A8H6WUK0_9AGAR|nr:hypothetical protein MVEN_02517200 [Mycena venus]